MNVVGKDGVIIMKKQDKHTKNTLKVILYSYLILKKMNEHITDS